MRWFVWIFYYIFVCMDEFKGVDGSSEVFVFIVWVVCGSVDGIGNCGV